MVHPIWYTRRVFEGCNGTLIGGVSIHLMECSTASVVGTPKEV